MRILQIIPNLGSGGAERFVVDLSNELAKYHEVYLCTLFALKEGENDFFLKDVNKNVKLLSLDKKLGLDIKLFYSLFNLIKRVDPDVINTHLSSVNYVLPTVLVPSRRLYFHTIHNDANKEVKAKTEFLIRKAFYKKKLIYPIAISDGGNRSFAEKYKMNAFTIYNGRKNELPTTLLETVRKEVSTLKNNANSIVLLNIGALKYQKNQVVLAKAVDNLINEGHDILLLIIGGERGKESKEIRREIEAIGNNKIYFLGTKDNVIDYLSVADGFCLSSLYEGMPISLIEAMAVGCIPICTNVGGIPAMIEHGTTGFLSQGTTVHALELAIKNYMTSSDKTLIKQNLIKEFNQKYKISSTATAYHKYYKALGNFISVDSK